MKAPIQKLPKPAEIHVPKIPPIENFQLTSEYLGYVTKPDPTNIAAAYLVAGSQNMVTNNGDQVSSRKGFTLKGQAGSNLGSELITNGGFTGSASGWTLSGNWVYGTNNVIYL
jgi:hypothetical protein